MALVRKLGEAESPPTGIIADGVALGLSVNSLVIDILTVEDDGSLHSASVSAEEDKDVGEKMKKTPTHNRDEEGEQGNEAREQQHREIEAT